MTSALNDGEIGSGRHVTNLHVQRISDAISMMARLKPATPFHLACEIPGFIQLVPEKAWEVSCNGFRMVGFLSENGADGLLHAIHNRRVAIKFCDRSEYEHREALFSHPDWIAVEFSRPQSANFQSTNGIFHVRPEFIDLLFQVEPGARYLRVAGPTHMTYRSGRG